MLIQLNGRLQSGIAKCGEATDGTNNDVKCNIYDMAGNVCEYDTEYSTISNTPYVARGGFYSSTLQKAGSRLAVYNPSIYSETYSNGCRPIIYL